jgi:two-component system sensor histidine kinase KdpD
LAAKSRQGEFHRIAAENEKNRSALLSAVSHDLRTPLAAIEGAASSLLERGQDLSPEARQQLLRSIYEEADRLNHLVQNLLDMTRLESDALRINREWNSVEELVGTAMTRLKEPLKDRAVSLQWAVDLPLVSMDALLMEQLLLNLLENALNHTPAGTPIRIRAKVANGVLKLEVSDQGPGILPGEEDVIFEKFTRGRQSGARGVGLGLSICKAIAQAHGGVITASRPAGGGACFTLTMPTGGDPPVMKEE